MNSKGQFTYCNVLTVGEASEKKFKNILSSHNSAIQIFECPSLFANMNIYKKILYILNVWNIWDILYGFYKSISVNCCPP